jgi:hypothetical protein
MPRRPGQSIWYIDAHGNVQVGSFINERDGNVTLGVAGAGTITVRDINTFNTEVAANRAQVNRWSAKSGH